MFGFGSRKRTPTPTGMHCFGVRTRIAKSVGKGPGHCAWRAAAGAAGE